MRSLIARTLAAVARVAAIAAVAGALSACSEPAEKLALHFENMALIAENNEEDCAAVGAELGEYLDSNGSEIETLAGKTGESAPEQAGRIDVASRRLDKVVEPCRSVPSVDAFATSLSEIVLRATQLKKN